MSRRMSDSEALLWGLGQNPHLASTMGALVLFDGIPDSERLTNTVARAVAEIPALHELVRESRVPIDHPSWVPDDQFDLGHHLRFQRMPVGSNTHDLEDAACRLVNDPFDRTRPLWQMTVMSGLRNRKSALVVKLHHSIADGQGALALAERLLEFSPDATPPEPFDLEAELSTWAPAPEDDSQRTLADTIRLGAERVIAALNDAAGTLNEPTRLASAGGDAIAAGRSLLGELPGTEQTASALLSNRSRNRRFYALRAPVDDFKTAARSIEAPDGPVSLNDLFVALAGEAVVRYHRRFGTPIDSLSATAVISTRTADGEARTNAFLPVSITIPGGDATRDEQVLAVGHQVRAKREQLAHQPDLLRVIGSVSAVVPSTLMAAVAVEQASRIDFATSNMPGPPVPIWMAGTKIRHLIPIGPVAGTAFNLTLLSYDDTAELGLHVDPVAVSHPDHLRDDLIAACRDAGVRLGV